MTSINRYGLKRSDLTEEQRRQLRQEAGFGCVICGIAIGDYEHIDPEFTDAQVHDVARMAFLCIQCHGKVTRRMLSKATVLAAKQRPKARQKGFSFEAFDVGFAAPKVRFGPLTATNCQSVIRVNKRPIFWVKEPEVDGGPFRLGAEMRNARGDLIFSIDDNTWAARTGNWDVEVVGPVITIRNGPRDIALKLRSNPPHELLVERINMNVEGYLIICDGDRFSVISPYGAPMSAQYADIEGCEVAVDLEEGDMMFGVGGGSVRMRGLRIG